MKNTVNLQYKNLLPLLMATGFLIVGNILNPHQSLSTMRNHPLIYFFYFSTFPSIFQNGAFDFDILATE